MGAGKTNKDNMDLQYLLSVLQHAFLTNIPLRNVHFTLFPVLQKTGIKKAI